MKKDLMTLPAKMKDIERISSVTITQAGRSPQSKS